MSGFFQYFQNLTTVNSCLQKKEELTSSGEIAQIKERIKNANPEEKKSLGQRLNHLRQDLQAACDTQIQQIQTEQEKDRFTEFDPSFFSAKYMTGGGSLHPITQVTAEIVGIFQKMGFDVADGPLVETQNYCFTLLNQPDYHPARAMQDTFYLEQKDKMGENYILRTQTSAVQIRYGESHRPPFKVVVPGQVYRNENIDATHDIMFHQIECLVIDKVISVAHLKTLIQQFYSQFFGDSNLKVRLRPSYFPYTVPSLEVDISNPFKDKGSGKLAGQDWIEVGGSGLVHPQVIRNIGLDDNQWQGLAFGFGLDRMAQLKLGISGLGQFFNGNLEFLKGKDFGNLVL